MSMTNMYHNNKLQIKYRENVGRNTFRALCLIHYNYYVYVFSTCIIFIGFKSVYMLKCCFAKDRKRNKM